MEVLRLISWAIMTISFFTFCLQQPGTLSKDSAYPREGISRFPGRLSTGSLKSKNIIETDIDHSTKTEWINGKSQKVLKALRERIGLENL